MESNLTPMSGSAKDAGTETAPPQPVPKKRPWWVGGRGLPSAITLTAIWTTAFVIHLTLLGSEHDVLDVCVAIWWGLAAITSAVSIPFWIRNRPVRMDAETGELLP